MSFSRLFSRFSLLTLFVSVLIFPGCETRQESEYEVLTFNVDQNLLGKSFRDSSQNFTFHPPINWNPVSVDMLHEIEKQLDLKIGDNYQLTPIQIFFFNQQQSFCSVSKVDSNEMNFTEYAGFLKQEIARKLPATQMRDGFFKIRKLPCYQLVLFDKQRINMKLIFTGARNLMQIDYVVQRQYYPKSIRAIESSIGSLRDLNHQNLK